MNVVHSMHLLNAAPNEGTEEAEESFRAASVAAARNGFMQDRALTHKLAGIYYLERGDDTGPTTTLIWPTVIWTGRRGQRLQIS